MQATIVVPGLLVISKTEAITAWRSICSSGSNPAAGVAPAAGADGPVINYTPRHKNTPEKPKVATVSEKTASFASSHEPAPATPSEEHPHSLRDGRDVYLLRFESDRMLKTGRRVACILGIMPVLTQSLATSKALVRAYMRGRRLLTFAVGAKLKGKLKGQIIKRTALNAYFAAVKLPL